MLSNAIFHNPCENKDVCITLLKHECMTFGKCFVYHYFWHADGHALQFEVVLLVSSLWDMIYTPDTMTVVYRIYNTMHCETRQWFLASPSCSSVLLINSILPVCIILHAISIGRLKRLQVNHFNKIIRPMKMKIEQMLRSHCIKDSQSNRVPSFSTRA